MTNTTRSLGNAAVLALLAGGALAQDLAVPSGAVSTRDLVQDPGAYALPLGPWARETGVPVARIEGRVQVQAFRIDGTALTPLQIILPLRAQLEEQGFATVLDCAAPTCGGFDFRFDTFVLPAPQMNVDLTNYHVFTARAEDGSGVALLASKGGTAAYLQIVRAGARGGSTTGSGAAAPTPTQPSGPSAPAGPLGETLETRGFAILAGVTFTTGSVDLGDEAIASLEDLARFLIAQPQTRIALVGHTDAIGSLEGNVSLSRRRAQAAKDYLTGRHGIDAGRISAEGAGYLAPVASNLTDAGREQNRRVEVVLLP